MLWPWFPKFSWMCSKPPFAPFPNIGYQRLLCPEKQFTPCGSAVSWDRGESKIVGEGEQREGGWSFEVQDHDRPFPVVSTGGNVCGPDVKSTIKYGKLKISGIQGICALLSQEWTFLFGPRLSFHSWLFPQGCVYLKQLTRGHRFTAQYLQLFFLDWRVKSKLLCIGKFSGV